LNLKKFIVKVLCVCGKVTEICQYNEEYHLINTLLLSWSYESSHQFDLRTISAYIFQSISMRWKTVLVEHSNNNGI
jgi:hypothetical protein